MKFIQNPITGSYINADLITTIKEHADGVEVRVQGAQAPFLLTDTTVEGLVNRLEGGLNLTQYKPSEAVADEIKKVAATRTTKKGEA